MSDCYKLFEEEVTYPQAEINCTNEGGRLAEPLTILQSEFLESLVDWTSDPNLKPGANDTDPDNVTTIWLKHRLENISDTDFFTNLLQGTENGYTYRYVN